jgi:hypothetical protein
MTSTTQLWVLYTSFVTTIAGRVFLIAHRATWAPLCFGRTFVPVLSQRITALETFVLAVLAFGSMCFAAGYGLRRVSR